MAIAKLAAGITFSATSGWIDKAVIALPMLSDGWNEELRTLDWRDHLCQQKFNLLMMKRLTGIGDIEHVQRQQVL